jgi:O-methyltransferase
VGLFSLTPDARRYFVAAAAAAARALGLHGVGAADVDACAARLGLSRTHRLRALADVLQLEAAWRDAPASLPAGGWGQLAEVIRRDRPLDAEDMLARFHAHLAAVGDDDARALAARLATLPESARGLVDLGSGVGHYAAAFLDAAPSAQATLVDRADVLLLVAPRPRQRLVAGDLFAVAVERHGVALLANVVHLYDAADGARLVERAAALADVVVVKDLWIEPDRSGPAASLYFALNMALFTDGGEVHPAARIVAWLTAAGLGETHVERLGDDVVVWGRR